jgi:hypothetical protein
VTPTLDHKTDETLFQREITNKMEKETLYDIIELVRGYIGVFIISALMYYGIL